ncbi:MAG: glycosyltransferase, partial [Ignavibacteria bacterium]|nr:glycosyltransferase [Ignavibacteria bacterium]
FLNKFEYYIKHGEERDQIINNGMKHVFSKHTYFHRIDKLIEFLDKNSDLFYSPQKKTPRENEK